jgi:hypothetical protein
LRSKAEPWNEGDRFLKILVIMGTLANRDLIDLPNTVTLHKESFMSESAPPPDPTPDPAARKEELRLAMKAFRKRLKLTKLDDESRIGHGPMSGGGKSGVVAITPPSQFPKDVWEELTEQGKLKRAGRGIYELVDP